MISPSTIQPVIHQSVIQKNVPAKGPAFGTGASTVVAKGTSGLAVPAVSPAVTLAEPMPASTENMPVVLEIKSAVGVGHTMFELLLDRSVAMHVFALANPYRVVIDLPEIEFRLPEDVGRTPVGLIGGFRFGLFAPGSSRIVIDTVGPVRIARSSANARGNGVAQIFELQSITPEAFAATVAATPAKTPNTIFRPTITASEQTGPRDDRFVVMIDPGHGGVDGGAVGTHVVEKDIVLAVARQLKAILEATGRYDVRTTRLSDTFVGLDQRVAMSAAANANLFLSIHADSVGDASLARSVRGATVYTLSDKASNLAAQSLADKENSADASGGLTTNGADDRGQVNSILADLMKRETQGFSSEFQQLLLERMRPGNLLARDPARAAAFRVLRQMQTPTVLLELGFISHQTDAEQMQAAEWQKRIATTIAAAIDAYALKRGPRAQRAAVR